MRVRVPEYISRLDTPAITEDMTLHQKLHYTYDERFKSSVETLKKMPTDCDLDVIPYLKASSDLAKSVRNIARLGVFKREGNLGKNDLKSGLNIAFTTAHDMQKHMGGSYQIRRQASEIIDEITEAQLALDAT